MGSFPLKVAKMVGGGVTVKDVNSHDFVKAYAAFLKKSGKIEVPKWAELVKTAPYKELAPYDPDWYYVRAASVARRIYVRPGAGVGAMRTVYGGKHRRGTCPGHHAKASGSVIRSVFQQLEKVKVLQVGENGGRTLTSTGRRDLDRIASQVAAAASK